MDNVCSDDSCCAFDMVPGGDFPMGRSESGTDAYDTSTFCGTGCTEDKPEHPVTVSTYALDRYEVTVGRFAGFYEDYDAFLASGKLSDGAGAHPKIPGSGWKSEWTQSIPPSAKALNSGSGLSCDSAFGTWNYLGNSPDANDPMNCVSWYLAFAFCIYDGGRLPTEAEWEYAAAGGSENRRYPWGQDVLNSGKVSYGCFFGGTECSSTDLVTPGTLPDGKGKFGTFDLLGNVEEWTLDWYDPAWYAAHGSPGSCVDCANVGDGFTERSVRGSHFMTEYQDVYATRRYGYGPAYFSSELGFRCARDL
jgi:formylglycine-generating enzyme